MVAADPSINDTIVPDVPAAVLQVARPEQEPDAYTPLFPENKDGTPKARPLVSRLQRKVYYVVFLIVLAAILIDIATYASVAPLVRIYESIICRSYYVKNDPSFLGPDGYAKEADCKIKSVQSELAMLRGWQTLCESIPGILFTIPYGILSDRIGRKPVIILSLGGICLYCAWTLIVCWFPDVFNIWLILCGTAFLAIGGGSTVCSSVIFVVLADVLSPDQRATVFFQISAAVMLSAFVSYPLASFLMLHNPWIPVVMSFSFFIIGTFGLFFLPETLNWKATSTEDNEEGQMERHEDAASETGSAQSYGTRLSFQELVGKLAQLIRETGSVFTSVAVATLTFTMLISSVGRSSLDLLMQYASTRFQWSFARASFLLTLQAGISVVLLLFVLPAISKLLTSRFSLHANTKDLHITRYSLLLIIIGLFGVGLSFSPPLLITALVVYSLGQGFVASLRSLLTSLVTPNQVGRLYAVMGVVQMIGPLVAGPTLSKAYGWGLDLGGLWDSLPFLSAAILHLFVALPLFILRLDSPPGEISLPETA